MLALVAMQLIRSSINLDKGSSKVGPTFIASVVSFLLFFLAVLLASDLTLIYWATSIAVHRSTRAAIYAGAAAACSTRTEHSFILVGKRQRRTFVTCRLLNQPNQTNSSRANYLSEAEIKAYTIFFFSCGMHRC